MSTRCNTLQNAATHCNTLQHTATHCNTLSTTYCNTLQHTATHRNTPQHTATTHYESSSVKEVSASPGLLQRVALQRSRFASNEHQVRLHANVPKCEPSNVYDLPPVCVQSVNGLQYTATNRTTLQHTAPPCNTTLRRTENIATTQCEHSSEYDLPPVCVLRVNGLQYTATHCNILQQHTMTHCETLQQHNARPADARFTSCLCPACQWAATHYNTRRHAATHCNALQHTATHCANTQRQTATHIPKRVHTATFCNNILQHRYPSSDPTNMSV